MKKIVLFAAAGLMSLAACQEKAGYIIKGTAEGVGSGCTSDRCRGVCGG